MKIIPKANRKIFPDNHQTTGSVGHGSFPFGLSDGPNNSRINQVATVIIIHLHISSYIMIYYVYYPKGPSTRLKPVPLCSLVLSRPGRNNLQAHQEKATPVCTTIGTASLDPMSLWGSPHGWIMKSGSAQQTQGLNEL